MVCSDPVRPPLIREPFQSLHGSGRATYHVMHMVRVSGRWAVASAGLVLSSTSAAAMAAPSRMPIVYIQPADYPPAALATHLEGDVPIALLMAPDGTVRCSIQPNERLAILKVPSCSIIAHRNPFKQHQGPNGELIQTEMRFLVRWRINDPSFYTATNFGGATPISPEAWITTDDYPTDLLMIHASGIVRAVFDIEADGQLTNCTIAQSSGHLRLDKLSCALLEKRATFLPAVSTDETPRATKAWMTMRWSTPSH